VVNRDEFQERMRAQFQTLLDLNSTKGHDYAGDEDALANFKRHAVELGVSPLVIWAVYASKHWDAVLTYIRDGAVKSEPVEGRISDLLLYLHLLAALVEEGD
jgi:hypothetical protein